MDRDKYIEHFTNQLDNEQFYVKVDEDPTVQLTTEIEKEVKSMEDFIDKSEYQLITEFLSNPRMAIFHVVSKDPQNIYRLPTFENYSFRI